MQKFKVRGHRINDQQHTMCIEPHVALLVMMPQDKRQTRSLEIHLSFLDCGNTEKFGGTDLVSKSVITSSAICSFHKRAL